MLVSRIKTFVGGHVWMFLVILYKKYIWPGQKFEQGVKLRKESQRTTHMFTNKVL